MSNATNIEEPPRPAQEHPEDRIGGLIARIASEFEVAMGSQARVKEVCTELSGLLVTAPVFPDPAQLQRLVSVVGKRTGAIVEPLFDLLAQLSWRIDDPWIVLQGMLNVRDGALMGIALEETLKLAQKGKLLVDLGVLEFFAERAANEGNPIGEAEHLKILANIIQLAALPLSDLRQDPLVWLYLSPHQVRLRQLAARILDAGAKPVSTDLARAVLGEDAVQVLATYLAFTRATHLDLLCLIPVPGQPPPCLSGVKEAEELCGSQLLREVISELGWSRFNFGLNAAKCVDITIGGSFPLVVSPAEASLFDGIEEAQRTGEHYLFTAHGGLPVESRKVSGEDDIVSRFRSYNLTHSEVLVDILDVAPLTREKVERILEKMNRIVDDFKALFSSYAEECGILPALYRELRDRILSEMDEERSEIQLSAELTRLVQMFEDPASLGGVRTLHGLKRYLHQRGLRLGFRLVESGRATNRTVTIVVASPKRVALITRDFEYVNFGSERNITRVTEIPYPVKAVVDSLSRQVLHGQQRLPGVRVFCYGNEVHYYLTFLNHPAFLRIDYSPPLRGGMIDLEYYGVSKNEIDLHPNISLDAIQQFFQKLEFDVQVENTRVHARYDKERALSLGDICEKVEALFRLAPYLMEIDWVIGSLDLSDEAKKTVAEAWARFFVSWGVLPIDQMLTQNRLGILLGIESGTASEREVVWSGELPYRDRFTTIRPKGLSHKLRTVLHELGQEVDPLFEEGGGHELGQIYLERMVLLPLRNAVVRGEIFESSEGYEKSPPELFERRHETEFFGEILSMEDEGSGVSPSLAAIMAPLEGDHPFPLGVRLSSFVLAHLVAPLERTLRFQTSGSLNGYEVQRAAMALSGKELGLYVLRDGAGIIRLAMFSHGESLYLRRQNPTMRWQSNGSIDPAEFAELLWLNNYLTAGMESVKTDVCVGAEDVLACFQRINPHQRPRPIPGDNLIEGLKASPGRAVAKVLFGTRGRQPEDFHDAILVAPSITPEDNSFLYHSTGVVSIGGGILSHAGLIAVQFHKPALIISGRWQESSGGPPFLLYSTVEYREEEKEVNGYKVSVRRDVHKRERRLQEGDLVVLDADDGILRILGQEREVLSLHESIRNFGEAGRRLARATEENEILVLRGRRLRARHQIEKHLTQLKDLLLAHHVVQELFVGKDLAGDGGTQNEKGRFLSQLLANRHVGVPSREFIFEISRNLQHRYDDRSAESKQRIPLSNNSYEILSLRLQVLRLCRALQETSTSLQSCNFEPIPCDTSGAAEITEHACKRLQHLRGTLVASVNERVSRGGEDSRLRHLVRQIQRLDTVLDTPSELRSTVGSLRNIIAQNDRLARQQLRDCRILGPADGGFEIYTAIGWKAANLAEIERLGGRHLVPPWFVVTNQAFQEVLNGPLDKTMGSAEGFPPNVATVSEAVDAILAREDWNNSQKSRQIRQLWGRIAIPQAIADEVAAAYDRLSNDIPAGFSPDGNDAEPFVAIRSSGREEDTENFTRAGEFETFLYIRGHKQLLEYLKRAWSGLWTERAIHNRAVLGTQLERVVGGIIIQRNAWSRVSGVLQTVNIAEDKLREMVINVGLGLGEGIVSGTVAADQIVVAKTDNLQNAPLRFRYITADKREQVVFNARAGYGVMRSSTLYHQRLRPAIEYIELAELVAIADRLEAAYGHPLDIEFGIEGAKLWILQARPVGTFPALLRETTQQYPFSGKS
jgi:hypothetical protein